MATPTNRSFQLLGPDGRTLHGALLSAGGIRPAVVICGGAVPELADRLARAGFAVVSFDLVDSANLDVVLDAVQSGTLGFSAATYGLVGHHTGAAIALRRSAGDERVRALVTVTAAPLDGGDDTPRERWLALPGPNPGVEQVVRASIDWFARHLS